MFKNFSENRALYDVWWKMIVQSGRPQIAIKCGEEEMSFARLITKQQNHNQLIPPDFLKCLWQYLINQKNG